MYSYGTLYLSHAQLCSIQRDVQTWKNGLAQFFEKLIQAEHNIVTEVTLYLSYTVILTL